MNKDREITKKFIQHAEQRGIKGLFITVDAPQLGRREKVRYGLVRLPNCLPEASDKCRTCV